MRLICELNEQVEILSEADASGKQRLYIQGITLQGNIQNKNGRVYPVDILEQEINRYIKEKVETGRAYGELGHPQGPALNLERVSHIFKEIKRSGNDFISKALVTEETPCGQIVKGLLSAGANLGISSRGLGSLKNRNGIMEVCNDFKLATAGDVVADPSAPQAFLHGLMEEVDWICDNGIWKPQQIEEAQHIVNVASRNPNKQILEQTVIKLFEDFIKNL